MHFSFFLLSILSTIDVTFATYSGRFCPLACDLTLNYVTFNDTDIASKKKIQSCRSELRINSLYLCFDEFCADDGQKEEWITGESLWCDEHAGHKLPAFHDVADRWTAHDRDALRRLSADEAKDFPTLNEIVLPDSSFYDRAFTTMEVAFGQYELHLVYGLYMFYFWIVVVSIGCTTRLISLIRNLSRQNRHYKPLFGGRVDTTTKGKSILSLPHAWLKRYVTMPATFGERCSRPYGWCTIPPRVQSLTIALFVSLNLVLCLISYQLTDGNLYWPEKSAQLLRFVSDRTGIISLVNFPLVWLFGMRNNMVMWATGWGFGTYNAFHRWVARVATFQAVVHSIGYTIMIWKSGGWPHFLTYLSKHYFWNGELATVAMCALLAFSFYGLRRAHYEIFLVTHVVLSIATLWTMYYHVEIFTNGEWNIFIWPCLVIWLLDRLQRLIRIFAFNRRIWNTKATVTYNSASNLVRLEIDGSESWLSPQPGTYYYIHVLDDRLHMHQSHPFTLAYMSSDTIYASSTPLSPVSSRPSAHRTNSSGSSESSESDALLTPLDRSPTSNLVFLIRPYDGFTSRLKSYCLLHSKELRVLVEGPYGHSEPLHLFPNILFIVGGTGIAVPLSHIARLLAPKSQIQSVKIVWAVREHAFLASILQDFKGLLADERVTMEVHITQDKEVMDEVLGADLKSVRIMTKRPDVPLAVQEAARDAGQQPLAVIACGPALMADQARKASVNMLSEGFRHVEYFEESFKW